MKIQGYALQFTDFQEVVLPKNSRILSITEDRGVPWMWVMVDEREEEIEAVEIATSRAGNQLRFNPGAATFIGTYWSHRHAVNLHVFRVR